MTISTSFLSATAANPWRASGDRRSACRSGGGCASPTCGKTIATTWPSPAQARALRRRRRRRCTSSATARRVPPLRSAPPTTSSAPAPPQQPADPAADRLLGVGEARPSAIPRGRDQRCRERRHQLEPAEQAHRRYARRHTEACEAADRIPVAHGDPSVVSACAPRGGEEDERPLGGSGRGRRNLLVFFSALRSGPARRMESLLARSRHEGAAPARVLARVDVEQQPEALRSDSTCAGSATLILIRGKRAVAVPARRPCERSR